jgi:histidine ammonia-lyase
VGASGDLAPLAHLASVLIGEGQAFFGGSKLAGGDALAKAGLKPIKLAPKEGISLINGTQQMTSQASLLLLRAEALADMADLICSASLEGTLGSPRAFMEWVHESRPFDGQKRTAKLLRDFMQGSEIYASHLTCDRVQDPYSIRCAPQVHGACRDLLAFVRKTVSVELNAATDNPLVNPDTGEIVSNGNFHGQPIAFALDIIGMAIAELANISERRIVKLLNPVFSELPTFLVKNEGLNSGFMIPQYTAASLVVENRVLTHPASTDSVPTNNDKEDHNSMGPIAARKAKLILENTEYVLAVEALAACQAIDFRKPLKPGRGPRFLHEQIRKDVPMLEKDRYMTPDMELVAGKLRNGEYFERAKQAGIL